jgi:Leucine Rich repeat
MRIVFVLVSLLITIGCQTEPPSAEPSFAQLIEQVRSGASTEIVVDKERIGDEQLRLLVDLPNLQYLAIDKFAGTVDGLQNVARLAGIERLQLRGGKIDDDAMQVIATCSNLRNLNLPDAQFSDTGLAELCSLEHLELLRFHSRHVTDDGLSHVAMMKRLRFLHLIGVPITDKGLEHLETMQQLESLYLDDANVTDEGIEKLLTALPELHFHINQQHSDRDPRRGTHPH